MNLNRRLAACDRLVDALAEELLSAADDDLHPDHGGGLPRSAADRIRRSVAEVLRSDAERRAPVRSDETWTGPAAPIRPALDEPR